MRFEGEGGEREVRGRRESEREEEGVGGGENQREGKESLASSQLFFRLFLTQN